MKGVVQAKSLKERTNNHLGRLIYTKDQGSVISFLIRLRHRQGSAAISSDQQGSAGFSTNSHRSAAIGNGQQQSTMIGPQSISIYGQLTYCMMLMNSSLLIFDVRFLLFILCKSHFYLNYLPIMLQRAILMYTNYQQLTPSIIIF